MKDSKIIKKTINGLLKRGYTPSDTVILDIHKTVNSDCKSNKSDPYYILGLVCDYGFYLGMQGSDIKIVL